MVPQQQHRLSIPRRTHRTKARRQRCQQGGIQFCWQHEIYLGHVGALDMADAGHMPHSEPHAPCSLLQLLLLLTYCLAQAT